MVGQTTRHRWRLSEGLLSFSSESFSDGSIQPFDVRRSEHLAAP